MKRFWNCVFVLTATLVAASPGANAGCLRELLAGYLCQECVDIYCTGAGSCEGGACAFTRKVCTVKKDVEHAGAGYSQVNSVTLPCFVVFKCLPQDPDKPCADDNQCAIDAWLFDSPTTGNTLVFSGTCPP